MNTMNRTADTERSETPVRRVLMVTLGCPKNLVDSENMCRIIRESGMQLVVRPEDADAIVVNTCGFIESAKKEAIDTLLEMATYKEQGSCRFLIATGCLTQRYADDMEESMPEIDAVLGTAHYGDIARVLRELPTWTEDHPIIRCGSPGSLEHLRPDRLLSTTGYAYLKIAEGCSNQCSYCAIPGIRGPFRSRPMADLIREARELAAQGIKELILIAQDTTRYGLDLPKEDGPVTLTTLLEALLDVEGFVRIRLLYGYLDAVTDDLIACMAEHPRIAPYLDVPVQHLSDPVLSAMNRRETRATITERVRTLRERIPGIVLRSTVMVGFPGETEEDVDALVDGIRDIAFDRLGCFIYSPEEGTAAYALPDRIEPETASARYARVMEAQQEIALRANTARIGTVTEVLLDSVSEEGVFYCGRSAGEAPEIDPVILVALSGDDPGTGAIVPVRIVSADEYEMTGVTV